MPVMRDIMANKSWGIEVRGNSFDGSGHPSDISKKPTRLCRQEAQRWVHHDHDLSHR